jgi:hypothetical protein
MKRITSAVVVLGFALAGTPALAEQAKPQPVQMNEAQLDAVAAGQVQITDGLVNVTVGDITVQDIPVRILTNSINGNTVQIPVAANAAGLARQYGRQN